MEDQDCFPEKTFRRTKSQMFLNHEKYGKILIGKCPSISFESKLTYLLRVPYGTEFIEIGTKHKESLGRYFIR
jgi:hypothetical protein